MNIIKRLQAPTPKFFRVLRNVGLTVTGIAGAILASPVVLPTAIVTLAGYFTVLGSVMSVVSQATIHHE